MSKIEGGLFAAPNFGGTGRLMDMWNSNNIYFVDAVNGSTGGPGKDPETPFALPSEAIDACAMGASIYIKPYILDQSLTAGQGVYYTDDIVIPYEKSGIALVGCGNPNPHNYAGVGIKPSTVTGTLIEIKSNSNLIENMHLTLAGGTSDSATGTNPQAIILMRRVITAGSLSRTYGNTVRGCRFSDDKSHPTITPACLTSSIALGCAVHTIIEDNIFEDCLGGIVMQSVIGNQEDTTVRRNVFGGKPSARDCDIVLSINNASCVNITIFDNIFADGKPHHVGGSHRRFISMPYVDYGTGILANNYFASSTVSNAMGESTGGTDSIVAENFFFCGNYYQGSGTTAPYGLITT